MAAGRLEEALHIVADEIAGTNSAQYHLAELLRIQGTLLLLRDEREAAEQGESCLLRAMEVARQQQARSFELRAAMSLCRCQSRTGQSAGFAALRTTYAWFTEGFDTHDLKEAKALLENEDMA
jgi:predicted ATPase